MRDRQRWMCRLCWVFVGFHLLAILQCSYTHRKVPQRISRQAVDARETVDGVPGVWSSWGPWSACSSSCGIGIVQQSRRCLAQETEGQRWALQPTGPQSQARPPHGESPWAPYSGQTVSALKPTYPLHVDSNTPTFARGPSPPQQAQQEAAGRQGGGAPSQHTLPLYGDGRPYGHGRPADGERASGQGYGQPANRESVPLYRQGQPSNHDRQRLPASYGAQRLTVRESRPLYAPEGSSTQGSASPSRPRTAANWRPSTGNRRSPMMRQDLRSSNRSRSSGGIRPGQYGYGKVPPNFRLHGAMAHLQGETPRDHQGHRSSSRQPRLAEAAPLSERQGRAQREALERNGTQRGWETEDRAAEEALVRPQHHWNGGAVTGQAQAPANQLSFAKPPNLARGVKLAASSPSEGLVPEEAAGDLHRQVGPTALATYNALHQRPLERALQDLNFTSLGLSGPLFVYEVPDIAESFAGVSLETSDSASFRDLPPRQVKDGSNLPTRPRRLSPGQGPGSEPRRSEREEASGRKGEQRVPSNRGDPAEPPGGETASRASTKKRRGSRLGPSAGESRRSSKSPNRKDQRDDLTPPRRSLSRSRRQGYGVVTDPTADIQEQDWNPHQWPSATCPGVERQYKSCTSSACPSADSDPRRAQCAGFNHLQFMGRYYEWEPFTEVRKDQRCELNCRPAGYRFYVRHADRVRDGTPCEGNSSDVCVGGRCLTPGCDGTLGSATRPDKCGVCGGDGSSCELVFGTFEDTQVNVGYHKIIEIPSGATKINVTELARSRNYLALRSRSGRSIINGNWAIDRPGKYEAAGTMFMYKRPTETSGESFYAEGPTTEGIDVYMIFQQENPGIHYEFVLPVEKPAHPPQNSHHPTQSYTVRTAGDQREVSALGSGPVVMHQGSLVPPRARGGQRDRRLQVYHTEAQEDPGRQQPVNRWTSLSATECSASCGKGFQYPIFRCVAQDTQAVVPDSHCDAGTKPASVGEACNTQSCPAFWSVGAWSECSKTCGPGIHHRQVLCRQAYANRTVAIHPNRCGHLEKPSATQPCQARACTHWQIQTDWESCSVPCGVGQRKRSIRCVSNQGDVVGEGECSGKPKPSDSETCDMGPCVKAWFYTDWSKQCSVECGVGVQKRSVLCLNSHINGRSPESCQGTRPPDTRACARGRCQRQVRWYASPWNQCPVQCGNGTQNRDLICVIKLGSDFTVTVPSDCAHLDRPPSVQPCSAGPCGARWFTTAWSECSKSCMGGVQAREVRCLDDGGIASSLCDATAKPEDQQMCHTHPCIPELDENCKDKYHKCLVVVQARLCTYSYYKMACCASCTHAERRATDLRRHDTAGRRGAA